MFRNEDHLIKMYFVIRCIVVRHVMGSRRVARMMLVLTMFISVTMLLVMLTVLPSAYLSRKGKVNDTALSSAGVEDDATLKPPLLCIFTTFKPVDYKTLVYQNVLRNWILLSPRRIRPVLFIPSADRWLFSRVPDGDQSPLNRTIGDLASSLGWLVVVPPRVNDHKVPHLKEMFFYVEKLYPDCLFYGYANGDVLFNDGLVRSLEAVAEVLGPLRRTLIVGKRTNVVLDAREIYLPCDVERLAKTEGRLFISDAQDYFFMTPQFPWSYIPDVVVGRPGYDNFLVATAIRKGVSVVDATRSLVALHQTDKDGNFAGHNRNNSDRNFNIRAMGSRFRSHSGHTTHSQYLTLVGREDGTVTVHRRYSRRRVWSSFWKRIGLA